MKGIIGYILAGLGLAVIAINFIKVVIPGIEVIPQTYIIAGGAVLVAAGVVFIFSGYKKHRSAGRPEIPIYEGSEIVGYRRR
jgi:hypothetical protein